MIFQTVRTHDGGAEAAGCAGLAAARLFTLSRYILGAPSKNNRPLTPSKPLRTKRERIVIENMKREYERSIKRHCVRKKVPDWFW